MPYPSKKIAITAEAIATVAEIEVAGGKRTLAINNHLIQDQITAQAVANAYLLEYKKQKTKMSVVVIAPIPYEVGDTFWQAGLIMPYKPAAEAEIPYKPAAEAEYYYESFYAGTGRYLIIRKINLRFSAGNFTSIIELEG